jgi:GNAT superfamily N-acetyltransferase
MPSNQSPVLRAAAPFSSVKSQHLKYAEGLHQTLQFRRIQSADRENVSALIGREVVGVSASYSMADDDGGVLAETKSQELVGAITVQGADYDGRIAIMVRSLSVESSWRGRGVATVLLGMLNQLLPDTTVATIYGNCSSEAVDLYARAGYTVLKEGASLPFALGSKAISMQLSNTAYPCWFFKGSLV